MKVCRRTGKVGYRSASEARAAVIALANKRESMARHYERRKRETGAYPCPHCPRWHLTSQVQTEESGGVNFEELLTGRLA